MTPPGCVHPGLGPMNAEVAAAKKAHAPDARTGNSNGCGTYLISVV